MLGAALFLIIKVTAFPYSVKQRHNVWPSYLRDQSPFNSLELLGLPHVLFVNAALTLCDL